MSSRQQAKEAARALRLAQTTALKETGLSPDIPDEVDPEYTVFAVYEDNLQPYSTTVTAGSPEVAVRLAQLQCLADNEAELADETPPDYGTCTLMGFQVARGRVETVPFDDMPLDVGHEVFCDESLDAPWSIEEILTDGVHLRARIRYGQKERVVSTSFLTPYPDPHYEDLDE